MAPSIESSFFFVIVIVVVVVVLVVMAIDLWNKYQNRSRKLVFFGIYDACDPCQILYQHHIDWNTYRTYFFYFKKWERKTHAQKIAIRKNINQHILLWILSSVCIAIAHFDIWFWQDICGVQSSTLYNYYYYYYFQNGFFYSFVRTADCQVQIGVESK